MTSRASHKCLDLLYSRPSTGLSRLGGPSRIPLRPGCLPVSTRRFDISSRDYATANAPATREKGTETLKTPLTIPNTGSKHVALKAAAKVAPKAAPKTRPIPAGKTAHPSTTKPVPSRAAKGTLKAAPQSTPDQPIPPLRPTPPKVTHVQEKAAGVAQKGLLTADEKRKSGQEAEDAIQKDLEKMKAKEKNEQDKAKGKSTDDIMQDQMNQIDYMMNMGRMFPTADPWGQKVETLDVQIPYSVGLSARSRYPSWRAMLDQFLTNKQGDAKNATSMWSLADSNAFPGVDLSRHGLRHKIFQWPWRVLQCRSLKPNSWLSPFRATALETYKELNIALAAQDIKALKRITTASHQDTLMKVLKKSTPGHIYKWRFHREISPVKVLSIRATEGYLAPEEPRFGNRMMVHALVQFDTEQSIEIYDKQGNPLHPHQASSENGRLTKMNVPAEKKRVTEYLVMEKRMWYDGPWMFRDQLWEVVGKGKVV